MFICALGLGSIFIGYLCLQLIENRGYICGAETTKNIVFIFANYTFTMIRIGNFVFITARNSGQVSDIIKILIEEIIRCFY